MNSKYLPVSAKIGCLTAIAVFAVASAKAADLPDPLGLRASCAQAPTMTSQDPELWLSPEKIAAEAVDFQRRSVSATVVLEVSRCTDRDSCTSLKANGTGTVVSGDGLVLTAYHVIADAVTVKATFRDVDADGYLVLTSRTREAKIVAVAPEQDVALLRLSPDAETYPHMRIECRWQADRRTPVWHFGQKSGWAFGRVTFKTTSSAGIAGVYETDAAAKHGDSGGPFVKATGELVGILLSINGGGKSYYMPIADAIAGLEKKAAAR